ncbi:uncharacterized protein [Miscanthus floridulus]|uniref:uncharacterized protein n=1 Tax=Miscanthus floridulus TaxID=154761 RepID=UPI003457A11E
MAPGASATGLASLGGGAEDALRLAIARPRAEADTPEIRASGKYAISPMGSMAGATRSPSQRVEEALESGEGRPVPADTRAVPPPPPPPSSRMRDAVRKLLCPRSRADPKEPVAQGEATEAATKQAGEEAPTPREAEALESGEDEAPSIAEAIEGEVEAPRTSEAKVAEARASRASKAKVADARAPRTTEAEVAEAGAPGTTEAKVAEAGLGAAEPAAHDAETEARQASVLPPVQDPPPSQESAREVEDDPEGEPLFALEDVDEGRHWGSFEQFCQLAERLLRTTLSVVADNLPGVAQELEARSLEKSMFLRRERDVWDLLRQQKDLLANANVLLSARSTVVEDLHLHCADMKAEVAMAREQAAPLAARIKELEEELTRVAGLEKEVTRAAEASVAVQAVLEAEIQEHNTL